MLTTSRTVYIIKAAEGHVLTQAADDTPIVDRWFASEMCSPTAEPADIKEITQAEADALAEAKAAAEAALAEQARQAAENPALIARPIAD